MYLLLTNKTDADKLYTVHEAACCLCAEESVGCALVSHLWSCFWNTLLFMAYPHIISCSQTWISSYFSPEKPERAICSALIEAGILWYVNTLSASDHSPPCISYSHARLTTTQCRLHQSWSGEQNAWFNNVMMASNERKC